MVHLVACRLALLFFYWICIYYCLNTNDITTTFSDNWANESPKGSDANNEDEQSASLIVADGCCSEIRELLIGSQLPVLWMRGDQHPISAITQALAIRRQQGSPVETLHWISHGRAGCLQVGDFSITEQTLIDQKLSLSSWEIYKIALWSCSAGADSKFLNQLQELIDAEVFASNYMINSKYKTIYRIKK